MIAYLRRRPMVGAVAIFVVFFLVGLVVISNVARDARRGSCRASLEERVVLRDFLAYARSRNSTPGASDFLSFFNDRLGIPPEVCSGTGIDVDAELEKIRKGRPPLPPVVTTTSVAPAPGPAGPAGPTGAPGPRGPGGSSPTTARPSPTTSTSSSTSTTRPRLIPLPTLPSRSGYAGGMPALLLLAAGWTIREAHSRRP